MIYFCSLYELMLILFEKKGKQNSQEDVGTKYDNGEGASDQNNGCINGQGQSKSYNDDEVGARVKTKGCIKGKWQIKRSKDGRAEARVETKFVYILGLRVKLVAEKEKKLRVCSLSNKGLKG